MQAVNNVEKNRNVKTVGLHSSKDLSQRFVSQGEIIEALNKWGKGLVSISKTHALKGDFTLRAKEVIAENYNYHRAPVLFKPTLAQANTFRLTKEGALSYFVGGNPAYTEDRGFALNNWADVKFDIAGVHEGIGYGLVMGNKHLVNSKGELTIANFTMGFVPDEDGSLKICLHHSSLPFMG
jgi:hypothetical protein